MVKVCHVTSAHAPENIRIFQKECVSLAKAGYDVTLVQQGESYEKNGVRITGFGAAETSRVKRMLFAARRAYRKALAVNADVYHLHDPELLPYGLKLKRRGKTVIFDSHEEVPSDILTKAWIPASLRGPVSWAYARYEAACLRRLDGVIGVTPAMCRRLEKSCRRSAMVTNYPILVENLPQPAFENRKLVFPGMIHECWNLHVLLRAMESIEDVTLELRAMQLMEPYGSSLRRLPGWEKVRFAERVPIEEVFRLYSECSCGVALLKKDHAGLGETGTLGNTKLFEYMMAGLPVVCTDFVLWKEIVDRWQCGVCVDPENAEEVSAAVRYLLDHPEEARRMGENGRKAVKEEFNWGAEEKKLLALYQEILNGGNG